ncbi:MAG: HNH endonuclease [Propionibacteriaceae bacterium]|jgi:5-methylcytosine-specific restriction endonuclease McrA|nr:HNH endonuclease [Propionibacteriaceae bacterium]
MTKPRGLDDHEYRKRVKALRDLRIPRCWICGRAIDYTLPPRHTMGFTADHVEPRSLGGDLYGELRPAHRACNSRRGNRVGRRPKTIAFTDPGVL